MSDELDNILNLFFEIELKTAEIYLSFHGRFMSDEDIASLWAGMAGDEIRHAKIIRALGLLSDRHRDLFSLPECLDIETLKVLLQKLNSLHAGIDKEVLSISSAIKVAAEIEDTFVEEFSALHHLQDTDLKDVIASLYSDSQGHLERLKMVQLTLYTNLLPTGEREG
ncbi:MAG: ferritin-like domain-containing protein [Nitrospinae bacterium]|nr:ferritin-like domain-containing protein [Nitrospinota bacterium]